MRASWMAFCASWMFMQVTSGIRIAAATGASTGAGTSAVLIGADVGVVTLVGATVGVAVTVTAAGAGAVTTCVTTGAEDV